MLLSCKTLLLSYAADQIEVHEFSASRSVSSVKQNRRGGWLEVVYLHMPNGNVQRDLLCAAFCH